MENINDIAVLLAVGSIILMFLLVYLHQRLYGVRGVFNKKGKRDINQFLKEEMTK